MKKILKHSIFLIMITFASQAQEKRIALVEQEYQNFSYKESSEELLKLVRKGNSSKAIYTKLANSYYYIGDMKNAAKWYGATLQKYLDNDAEISYRYAQALKGSGDIAGSNAQMKQFVRNFPNDTRAISYSKAGDYMATIKENSKAAPIENLSINTSFSDFGTTFYNGGIVFSSAKGGGQRYSWTNQGYLDLFYNDENSGKLDNFSKKINTKLHESSPAFSKDGQTMYFTRNNYFKRKIGRDENDVTLLKIYRAKLKNGKWKNIEPLPFNSDNYNVSHPAISPDGTKLYFASDMPGTLGDSDIFYVDLNLDDTYGKPQNLGNSINTAGKESFPFVSDQNVLYFSSNGHPGLGLLDVFKYDFEDENPQIMNMGKPVNSISDDFAYAVDNDKSLGYFSSNREGGKGDDDIYRYVSNEICKQSISGTVKDSLTQKNIETALVEIKDEDNNVLRTLYSDKEGKVIWDATCANKTYKVSTKKEGYITKETSFVTKENDMSIDLNLNLSPVPPSVVVEPVIAKAKEGTDLFKIKELDLQPLYFNLDKSDITPQAEIELAKIINYMNLYPDLKIDVRSHTDSRGSDAYNLALSDRRAKSTINYLINRGGINKTRITGRGYGETMLMNGCSNGVKCSETEHYLNRRSEFIVIK